MNIKSLYTDLCEISSDVPKSTKCKITATAPVVTALQILTDFKMHKKVRKLKGSQLYSVGKLGRYTVIRDLYTKENYLHVHVGNEVWCIDPDSISELQWKWMAV